MGYELRSVCQGETRRLLWLMVIMFAVIVAFQYIELPSVFSTGKVPAAEDNSSVAGGPQSMSEVVSEMANGSNSSGMYPVHGIANDTRAAKAENANLENDYAAEVNDDGGDTDYDESSTEKLEELNNNSKVNTIQNADNGPAPERGRESEQSLIKRNDIMGDNSKEVINESKNSTLTSRNKASSGGDAPLLADGTPDKNEKPLQSNFTALGELSSGSSASKKTKEPEIPTPAVITIAEMNNMLLQYHAKYRSMRPRWSSAVDQELIFARSQIENARLLKSDHELYAPLYRDVSMFKRSYELMEEMLKVYVYREGQRPILHTPLLQGIYASEGWFMKQLEANKHFVTKDSRKAHLFYLPFSSRMLEETLYVENSHSHKNLIQYLKNYVDKIASKHNFWNRTDGSDHFLVACHDWAPSETRRVMAKCIRALCNSDVKEGFVFGKDVSLPETYVRSPKDPLRELGGKPASKRPILAFFAGNMHGYLRPILLQQWANKDPDMKIFGQMPTAKRKGKGKGRSKGQMDYIQHMKSSKYCICAKGYEVNSPRVVEAIFYECVPVIISDNFVPPFFEILNWESFAVFVLEKDIPNLKNILLAIPEKKYHEMQMRVKKVQRHFLWHPNPEKYDLFHMILHSIWYNRVFLARASFFFYSLPRSVKMFSAQKKIHKDKDAEPTEFEESVAQAFFDLENTNQELKSELKDLYINSAMQIDVSGNRKAVVIHVPYRLRKAYRKIHVRLVRELEKKFSGKDVILIATRRILRPPKKGSAVQRPRTRTLTAVHEAMLEDVVLPAEIVGKRVRYRLDGSKIMKVFLDPKERNNTEYKLDTFAAVYRKLSGKDVVFEFPVTEA